MQDLPFDQLLDTRGLSCPLPLLKAKQALYQLQPGQVLKVLASDAGSVRDFRAYTDQSEHSLLASFTEQDDFVHIIRCASKSAGDA